MNRKRWLIATLVLAGVILLAAAAFLWERRIDDPHGHRPEAEVYADVARGTPGRPLIPLAKILELTSRHVPGEVVKVELEDEHGRRLYEIKVLAANGRVRELKFDAYDAQLIEIEDD
jgi:uncharacterized membrane protein YkoI